ncbi:unnamed protein product [Medioppia subpectinata]|uniref:Uncharacterized protein n=1 Tax=Medioppia subpectinata TaxID=1979941 RepID=A0A7R9QG60_9ACAR|nr:unnamed protein product [Medioppia subpectinata]CAG2119771.1 unnamed protein product [Medioppia subpectinata]
MTRQRPSSETARKWNPFHKTATSRTPKPRPQTLPEPTL